MNNLIERDLNNCADSTPKSNKNGRGVIWSATRYCLMGLAALAFLLPGGLIPSSASASDFEFYWQDQETGDDLFVNFITGDYFFFNGKKQSFVAGKGKINVSDCAMELHDNGPNRKHPDRAVQVSFNPCDNQLNAIAEFFDSGERYAINEQTAVRSPRASFSANSEATIATRFDGFCLEDDLRDYRLDFDGRVYTFTDRKKGTVLQGPGSLVINGCKWKLIHDGADPKHPDRHVYVEVNVCTREANATVWMAATGRTYLLHDSNIDDSCVRTHDN